MRSPKKMIAKSSNTLRRYFRTDLQLHFLWSFFLTISGVFFPLMIWSGLVATIIKEALDLWINKKWNWDDVVCGVVGWLLALFFLKNAFIL